jgi:DNA-binding MurR/RpiR family transcriptional regulator
MPDENAGQEAASLTIAQRVQRARDRLRPSERRAAQALLYDYPYTGLLTTSEFARRAGVSAPTILRLVTQLGFDSYRDFQRRLKGELAEQMQSPLAKASISPPDTRERSSLHDFGAALASNVQTSFDATSDADFAEAVALLTNRKKRIHAAGGRFTEAFAIYLVRHLRILRPHVASIDSAQTAWRDQIIDFDRNDVLICFDIRRYQENVIALAEAAAARDVTVILFTDRWLSPIARFAKISFPIWTNVPSEWDSTVAMLGLVESIIAATTSALWESARPRMEELEQLRHQRKGQGRDVGLDPAILS